MASTRGLAPRQLSTLDRLRGLRALRGFYLAGGSAIAFHLEHRRSVDLDLFSQTEGRDPPAIARAIIQHEPGARLLEISDAAASLTVGGVPVDVVAYPYPPLEPPRAGPRGFPVAGLKDLAAMKLSAIARRGIRRDFWDLHAILGTGLSLEAAVRAWKQRYARGAPDLYHLCRALTYFDDAERERALPAGLTPARWRALKRFFQEQVPSLLKADQR